MRIRTRRDMARKKRRADGRRRRRFLLVSSVSAMVVLAYIFLFSAIFEIRNINYYGNLDLPGEKLKTVEASVVGKSLFTTNLGVIREALLSSPVVKNVIFKRKLLHSIECYIIERKPIALIMGDEPLGVDEDGVLMRGRVDLKSVDLPILTGLDDSELSEDSGKRKIEKAMTVLRLFKESGFDTELEVSEVHVENEDIVLVVGSGGTIVRFGRDGYLDEMRKLKAIFKILDKNGDFPSMIDLRFSGQVVVR